MSRFVSYEVELAEALEEGAAGDGISLGPTDALLAAQALRLLGHLKGRVGDRRRLKALRSRAVAAIPRPIESGARPF